MYNVRLNCVKEKKDKKNIARESEREREIEREQRRFMRYKIIVQRRISFVYNSSIFNLIWNSREFT